jgi:tetratricopeptide (TPR) repeat protein
MSLASPASVNAAVARASAALATDPAAAQSEAEAVLQLAPADPRARLILASARRRRGDPRGALTILRPLASAYPQAAHTQYELGAALAATGDGKDAKTALRKAVALKADLAEAWRALGDLLFAEGDNPGADAAYAAYERVSVRDPALAPAAEALYAGRLSEAEDRLRAVIVANPLNPPALRLMAEVFRRGSRHTPAEVLLAQALTLEPGHAGTRLALANVLYRQQRAAEALDAVETLLAQDPREVVYLNLRAACLSALGRFEEAIGAYATLLERFPSQSRLWINQGHALRMVGRRKEAVAAYRRAIEVSPGLGEAYWSLADLKAEPLSAANEAAMAAQLEREDLPLDDRVNLHFALGKALEDRADHPGAFGHYAKGAALHPRPEKYAPGEDVELMGRVGRLFTAPFLAAREGWGCPAPDPIFIVGLPRSGSTLIEQILASHSAVEGTMELPDIGHLASRLADGDTPLEYPEGLAQLDATTLRRLGEAYLDRTRVQRRLGRPMFIDKMPNNFRHIGFIQMILPRARIIDARRHPMAACFSSFKQHFAQGQEFTYDLGELGRYYRAYVELMSHFDDVLPGRVHRVIYEDLVEDTETEVRRLLEYCGLGFEPACLRFYENDRAVRTVSSEQVRRPIFRDGLDQWRRYEPWLGPLKAALGPALETWRGSGRKP